MRSMHVTDTPIDQVNIVTTRGLIQKKKRTRSFTEKVKYCLNYFVVVLYPRNKFLALNQKL